MGIIQPVLDGFKLFLKEYNWRFKSPTMFILGPIISFIFSYSIWFIFLLQSMQLKFLFLLLFFRIRVYSFVLSGWARFSKFGFIGGIRASSQTVSYEVGLSILFFISFIFFSSFSIVINFEFLFFYYVFFLLCWILVIVAETNRAPFDFSEGERELISGFNVEYGSGGFVLFFLSEYSSIIFFSILLSFLFNLKIVFVLILFILIKLRTCFPRFRYDMLLGIIWFYLLPYLCGLLIFFILIK